MPCAMGLVGVECCPAPSGISMSQMAINVTTVSWQQKDLAEKTKH